MNNDEILKKYEKEFGATSNYRLWKKMMSEARKDEQDKPYLPTPKEIIYLNAIGIEYTKVGEMIGFKCNDGDFFKSPIEAFDHARDGICEGKLYGQGKEIFEQIRKINAYQKPMADGGKRIFPDGIDEAEYLALEKRYGGI